MMLKDRNAIIYGAGGSMGGAIAKALAEAGARLFLAGRTLVSVQKLADEINALGGVADACQLDALDEQAIRDHLAAVVQKAGSVDISFNAIGVDAVQNIPLVDMSADDFTRPIKIAMQSQFLTATAAAKVMMKQSSGIILTLTATPGGIGYPYTGGFGPACSAIESFSRNLAAEVGIYGVRVVNIRSGGSPDSKEFKEAIERVPDEMKMVLSGMENDTMLKSLPLMEDIANVAVFLASPMAAKVTGVTIDVTAGSTAALNYRAHR